MISWIYHFVVDAAHVPPQDQLLRTIAMEKSVTIARNDEGEQW